MHMTVEQSSQLCSSGKLFLETCRDVAAGICSHCERRTSMRSNTDVVQEAKALVCALVPPEEGWIRLRSGLCAGQ